MQNNSQNLSFKEVIEIRKRNRNPDVTFAPKLKYCNLGNKTYKEMVEIIISRFNRWYFNVAEKLSEEGENAIEGSNFTVITLTCIIIDSLSQYYYGLAASNRDKFRTFFRKHFSNYKLKNPIKSCTYNEFRKTWRKVIIKDIADALYFGFRCGLVHSCRIMEYGRINTLNKKKPIEVVPWKSNKNKYDIQINPVLLLKELKKVFTKYAHNLRHYRSKALKQNFVRKLKFDYGIDLRK